MQARIIQLHHKTRLKLIALKKEAEQEGEYRVAKRIHAVLLNHAEHSSIEIARLLEAPRSKVSEWLRNYEDYGYEALLEGQRSGRPRALDEKQLIFLSDIVESGPVAYGFLSGVWTSKMIAQVISEEFDVDYHRSHVCRILDELDFSMQRPKKLLAKADPQKQNRWRRSTYPNIKKKRAIGMQK